MDQRPDQPGAFSGAAQVLRCGFAKCDAVNVVAELAQALGANDLDLVVVFVSPQADVDGLIRRARDHFAPTPVVGCTTAGEISGSGYSEGEVVAIGFPSALFRCRVILVDDLGRFDGHDLIDRMIRNRHEMNQQTPDWNSEFTFLLIDGLSTKEDELISELAVGLGPVPLFGGSAGDGTDFNKTFVLHGGRAHSNAAVLIQVRSTCRVSVFKTDHLIPTDTRMVVTSADPARRLVHELNAEPAAREYARILGKDPEQLTTFTFAAHPVVVRIGGQHHVRSIQRVAENGDLVFFSAIDEGVVLSLAEPENMVDHLNKEMARLSQGGAPAAILACDCILRRMEAQQNQMIGPISKILQQNRVVGFSTYGEQINTMHVNQTLTGVAIYPPEPG